MNVTELQQWLVGRGQSVPVDGMSSPAMQAAIPQAFVNLNAPAVTADEIAHFAAEIGCTPKQLNTIATVESAGGGFDQQGRPKILFERHYFHRLTGGRWSPTIYSDPHPGGYGADSWSKLALAAGKDPDAAFASASWGKFQIMAAHWQALGYSSPLGMAFSMTMGERMHYVALVKFVEVNGLADKIKALSADPADCAALARAYNGPAYRENRYDQKLAEAMR